jgi:hypothetical protein
MFSLSNLLWLLVAGIALVYWWNSGSFKGRARDLAISHCRQLDLQLLDQSMVIHGIWPVKSINHGFCFRRNYQFEFTSTGEQRYQGLLVLEGLTLKSIDLEAYKIPMSDREIDV